MGPCVRSDPAARGKVRPAEQEAGGGKKKAAAPAERQLQPRRELGPQQPRAQVAAERGLDPCRDVAPRKPRPCGLLGDPGLGPLGEAPAPGSGLDLLEDARSPVAGRGAASGAPHTPGLLGRACEDGEPAPRPSCAVWLRDLSAGLGAPSSPAWPPAHSRVLLLPIPGGAPCGPGVSATGEGRAIMGPQAGNSPEGP